MLQRHGLNNFYRFRMDEEAKPAITSDRTYAEFDDPAFDELYCRPLGQGDAEDAHTKSVELYLEGVHCTACVWLVERLPALVPGVISSRLDLGRSMARISWDASQVELSKVARTLDDVGYPTHPFRGVSVREMRRKEDRRLLTRIGVAGAAAGNVMLIALALYAGYFSEMQAEYFHFFRWVSFAISLPAVIWCGLPFYRGALAGLRLRTLHMDLPISIGIVTGMVWGCANTFRGVGEIYFDSVMVLIFLLLAGRWLQRRQQRSASDSTEMLYALTPSSARLIEGDSIREIPIDALQVGQRVQVRAGDSIPVDGIVIQGQSTINAALLTGEARPIPVAQGDNIEAGTLNLSSPLIVEVMAAGEETRVGRLMQQIEEQSRRKPPIVKLADRIAGYFVASALFLSVLCAVVWFFIDATRAVENAVALLIVTCPCALGLATPLAVSAAIGRAAKRGILVKGGDTLERLAHVGELFFDKTGTLTEGRQSLVFWQGSDETKQCAAALEQESAHPLAHAFVEAVPADAQRVVGEVEEYLGGGIAGTVQGRRIVVGSPRYLESLFGEPAADVAAEVARLSGEGITPVVVYEDSQFAGLAGFADPLGFDTEDTLQRIRQTNWKLAILSGDHTNVVKAMAGQLGIAKERALGSCSPEEKADVISRAAKTGPTVMVGDGVNDAAALAAATAGIAVAGGAEASLAAADAYIGQPGLSGVADLLQGARETLRVIRRNLAFSLGYNLIGVTLAFSGLIGPLVAAILMPLSSLTVVTSSYRFGAFTRD
jgi:P-type Cu2+ transporter